MATKPCIHTYTSKTLGSPPLLAAVGNFPNRAPYCLSRSLEKLVRANASSSDATQNSPSSSKRKRLLRLVLDAPRIIWKRKLQPMGDFGFGRRGMWEGGVGLFVVSGVALFALTWAWLRGFQLRSWFRKYQALFEFSQACGIYVGTPVSIQGVTVGNVLSVESSVKYIEAVAEVDDDKIVIPRNSLVEVNQSGLLMETLIDITPRDPLPIPSIGPLEPDCIKEGLIVCDRERIRGRRGVSLDELVGILTRVGREADEIGLAKSYELGEKVAAVMQEAQPLLTKIETMAEDIQPLLAEVRNTSLLKDAESLTRNLAEATEELRKVQTSIFTPETTEEITESIVSLIFTLENIEMLRFILL